MYHMPCLIEKQTLFNSQLNKLMIKLLNVFVAHYGKALR